MISGLVWSDMQHVRWQCLDRNTLPPSSLLAPIIAWLLNHAAEQALAVIMQASEVNESQWLTDDWTEPYSAIP